MRRSIVLSLAVVASAVAQPGAPEIRRAVPVNPAATPDDTEIRRAEPVNPDAFANPAWMDRVPRATPAEAPAGRVIAPAPEISPAIAPVPEMPVMRAEPVLPEVTPSTPDAEAVPVAPIIPQAVETAPPLREPPGIPAMTDPVLSPSPASGPQTVDDVAIDGESIRLSPGAPVTGAQRSLVAANGFYRRKMYEMAVFEYEKFLISDPSSEERDGALFRLAESHRFLGNDRAAKEGYERLVAEFSKGEFVGAGAFRLAEILFATGNYRGALDLYRRALANSKEREVQITAEFFMANALDKLNRPAEALVAYQAIADGDESNPYREDARFFVAEALSKSDRKPEALAAFEALGSDATKPAMQAEALIKAAALAAELNENDRARRLFESALAHPEIGSWRGVATLGLLRIAYSSEDYKKASTLSEGEIVALPEDARAEAILIAANANRQLGQRDAAVAGYDRILAQFPNSDVALQARFQRLLSLNVTDSSVMLNEIDAFLQQSTSPRERAQANLMKAETLFNDGKFAEAAPLYAAVMKSNLPNRLKEQAMFKLGWAQVQMNESATAEKTFRDFIKAYPKSDLTASAQTQLALALQRSENYADAIKAFDQLLKDHRGAPDRELALQQKALTLGQLEDYAAMSATFEQLLEEFPESPAAGQAYFWIGWAKFEEKDYAAAINALTRARETDAAQYGERSTIRIVLSHFYNKDRAAVAKEAESLPAESIPPEVIGWLASEFFAEGDFASAEKFLEPMVAGSETRPVDVNVFLQLARARIALEKFGAAEDPVSRYLATARDPASRARGLLLSAEIAIGRGDEAAADRYIEESLLLQPEGRLNAEARMLNGRALAKRGRNEEAARAFATVAILYDDPVITPEALQQASSAYRKAGNATEADKMQAELRQRFPESAQN